MIFTQDQALPSNFKRRRMFRPHAVSQVGTPEDRHLLVQGAGIAKQIASVQEYPGRLLCSVAFRSRDCRSQGQVEVQLLANAFGELR